MLRRSLISCTIAALALVPMTGMVQAQSTTTTQAQSGSVDAAKLPALEGGDFATATSELAVSKATHPSVKAFANLEIAEQAATARAFGSQPGAAGLTEAHAAMLAQLEAAEGAEFDMMYIEGQITGHEELLQIHQNYARNGDDPMARGASMVGVTGIQTHLVMLQSIERSLGQ